MSSPNNQEQAQAHRRQTRNRDAFEYMNGAINEFVEDTLKDKLSTALQSAKDDFAKIMNAAIEKLEVQLDSKMIQNIANMEARLDSKMTQMETRITSKVDDVKLSVDMMFVFIFNYLS